VTQSCIDGAWRNIWPDVVTDFHGFEPEEEISNSRRAIVDMARSLGFEEVDEANVKEFLQSHMEELSNEDLLKLEKELSDEDDEFSDVVPVKHLTTNQLVEFFKHTNIAIGIIDDNAANRERSAKVARGTESALASYKELYRERQKAARQPLSPSLQES
jgi:NH3-dependent NAD+ synthetase